MFKRILTVLKPRRPQFYNFYLTVVGVAGVLLLILGFARFFTYHPLLHFLLLALLAAVSAIVTTSVAVGNSGITYSVSPTIGAAAIPYFGVNAGILLVAIASISPWFVKRSDQTWKKSWPQLFFNVGMHSVAMAISGELLLITRELCGPETFLGQTLPWLIVGFAFEELNFWMLAVIMWLQHDGGLNLAKMWREEFWATQIGGLVTAVGGWLLAYAMQHYDAIGIAMFFMPILLSAYAFRLYVRQMQAHLDNLEQIVSDRTKELAKRSEELAAINQQKDMFLSVLTHDMMTPLGNIQFCTEAIQEDEGISEDTKQLAQLAQRSQQMLYYLVRNVLDLEKLQAVGTLTSYKTPIEFGHVIKGLVEMMQLEAAAKSISLQLQQHPEPIPLYADRQQLERVILNLISNAIKYTNSGGSVRVSTTVANKMVMVAVADTGYGIPAEELPYIFERFRRIKQLEDKASGTGLGLAITKALVEQHGGTITIESERGKGSTFTVRLPVETPATK